MAYFSGREFYFHEEDKNLLIKACVYGLIAIICFVYKLVRYYKEPEKENKIDKLPIEAIFLLTFLIFLLENTLIRGSYYFVLGILIVFYVIDALLILTILKTIIKRIKNKTIKESFAVRKILIHIKSIYKMTALLIIIFLINILIIQDSKLIFVAIPIDIVCILYGVKIVREYQKICNVIKEIREGNFNKKIDKTCILFQNLAGDINQIGEGLQKAMEEKLKSERLKTDLITNVSHDLKTPLTSIMNYISLIKKEEIENKNVNKYVKVLEEKSVKLKNLTDDLVEISKISSGNESVKKEQLNISEMILQANGEFAEKFASKNLEIISKISSPQIQILIDGKKMGRVLENLYQNVYKYALENTRVYVNLIEEENTVKYSISNISREPLNIQPDELKERFVRGDTSRNTEGSGLRIIYCRRINKTPGRYFYNPYRRGLI